MQGCIIVLSGAVRGGACIDVYAGVAFLLTSYDYCAWLLVVLAREFVVEGISVI